MRHFLLQCSDANIRRGPSRRILSDGNISPFLLITPFSIDFAVALGGPLTFPLRRSASIESTQSEREFRRRHQAITHRMVHRKSSAIMYNKILERTFGELQ